MKETEEKLKKFNRGKKGITLVALVITIIIIIILATVTINMAFGDNGLIKQSQLAKDMVSNSVVSEQEEMNRLMDEYANVMAEDSEISKPFIDILPDKPKITEGMIPVKYDEIEKVWIKTTINDKEWYDYSEDSKKWANVVLGDATFFKVGDKEILNEEQQYSMLVWIPRYAYKITKGWHSGETGSIEIVFIDCNNQNKDKSITYKSGQENYLDTIKELENGGMNDFIVHPAFDYGNNNEHKLTGFWVGKYETSHTGCNLDASSGQQEFTGNEILQIKANVSSWRNISVGKMFKTCVDINKSQNIYGLNSSDDVVDPHLTKNTEWGAVAYLSISKYGKNNEEIWINNNQNYVTGRAGNSVSEADDPNSGSNEYNSINGQKASTTGNVYGVYDMSGGACERVAAFIYNSYIDNTESDTYIYGKEMIDESKINPRYVDRYSVGVEDSRSSNYAANANKYGDAIYETSITADASVGGWFGDWTGMPYGASTYFLRSAGYFEETYAGVFFITTGVIEENANDGFRTTITII